MAALGEFQCAAAEVVVDFAVVHTPHVDGVAELFFTLFVVVVVVEFLHFRAHEVSGDVLPGHVRLHAVQPREFVDVSGFDGAGASWCSEIVLGVVLQDEPAASLCFDLVRHVVG